MKGKRKEKSKIIGHLKNHLVQYLSEATAHGFRYIIEGRNIYERLAWFSVVVVGFATCVVFLLSEHHHWQSDPAQTTLDQVSIPVHNLPFPSITVCDTKSLQMPRRNRWMFVENFLNAFELKNVSKLVEEMYPGRSIMTINVTL